MDKPTILIQLDTDPHPSVFDRVVAVDAGAAHVFSYGGVRPEHVRELVHGAIFTRGPKDLKRTAIFIGGSDVGLGEQLLKEVRKHLLPQFGLQVSVLLDANGANTTAAAAVYCASRHIGLASIQAVVLAGTGPVGQRVSRLLARQGARVRVCSRQHPKAEAVCAKLRAIMLDGRFEPAGTSEDKELSAAMAGCELVFAAGTAGALLLPSSVRRSANQLRVAIDLNAVPPLGIEGVEMTDRATERDGVITYGAIGVGGTKMKLHKAAISKLFERNDHVLDAEEVYSLASALG